MILATMVNRVKQKHGRQLIMSVFSLAKPFFRKTQNLYLWKQNIVAIESLSFDSKRKHLPKMN